MQRAETEHPVPALRLYRVNAGSCNGCDVEMAATSAVAEFDVEKLGCRYTETASEADIVLITGPLTLRTKDHVLHELSGIKEPKVTVAIGICAISGGVFRDSYAVDAPLQKHLQVDVNVPGCPPRPQALLAGIREALLILGAKRDGIPAALVTADIERHAESRETGNGVRGKLSFNAKACVDCRMCRHVCAAGAISFDQREDGVNFTLWHNSCVFCGLCVHYCPTGALTATGTWQLAHRREEGVRLVEHGVIPEGTCTGCGAPIMPLPPELMRRAFGGCNKDIDRLKNLCPECRQQESIGAPR